MEGAAGQDGRAVSAQQVGCAREGVVAEAKLTQFSTQAAAAANSPTTATTVSAALAATTTAASASTSPPPATSCQQDPAASTSAAVTSSPFSVNDRAATTFTDAGKVHPDTLKPERPLSPAGEASRSAAGAGTGKPLLNLRPPNLSSSSLVGYLMDFGKRSQDWLRRYGTGDTHPADVAGATGSTPAYGGNSGDAKPQSLSDLEVAALANPNLCLPDCEEEDFASAGSVTSVVEGRLVISEHGGAGLEEDAFVDWVHVDLEKNKDKPIPHLNIVILIVGSRGDVQPFVALGMALKQQGHFVRLATHECFRDFVLSHSLDFYPLAGDPKDLMAFMVNNEMMSMKFLTQGIPQHRRWVNDLLESAWAACSVHTALSEKHALQWLSDCWAASSGSFPNHVAPPAIPPFRATAIIANPPSFAGYHIAEKLAVPVHYMFTMPWTRTSEFPSPFAFVSTPTPRLNRLSFDLVERGIWLGIRGIVNRWRQGTLGIPPVRTWKMQGHRLVYDRQVPHTYAYSPNLLPKPHDWPACIDVCGFWFMEGDMDGSHAYTPPAEIEQFLNAGSPPVFVGFGSIVVRDPQRLTATVMEGLEKSGQRGIVQKGWAGIEGGSATPPSILVVGSVPHDWLFERCCAVVHHGGAGTTAAGLRAGKPTVVVPFFGDQFFWGGVVASRGVGPPPIPHAELTSDKLAAAIQAALAPDVVATAEEVSAQILCEQGVTRALSFFHMCLPLERMACSVNPIHLATVDCVECGMRLCAMCDAVVHLSVLPGKGAGTGTPPHTRHECVYHQWADQQSWARWAKEETKHAAQMLGRRVKSYLRGEEVPAPPPAPAAPSILPLAFVPEETLQDTCKRYSRALRRNVRSIDATTRTKSPMLSLQRDTHGGGGDPASTVRGTPAP